MNRRNSLAFGPRTQRNILKGRNIRKLEDGGDMFEDYWTDSDSDGENSIVSKKSDLLSNTSEKALSVDSISPNKTASDENSSVSKKSDHSSNVHEQVLCVSADVIKGIEAVNGDDAISVDSSNDITKNIDVGDDNLSPAELTTKKSYHETEILNESVALDNVVKKSEASETYKKKSVSMSKNKRTAEMEEINLHYDEYDTKIMQMIHKSDKDVGGNMRISVPSMKKMSLTQRSSIDNKHSRSNIKQILRSSENVKGKSSTSRGTTSFYKKLESKKKDIVQNKNDHVKHLPLKKRTFENSDLSSSTKNDSKSKKAKTHKVSNYVDNVHNLKTVSKKSRSVSRESDLSNTSKDTFDIDEVDNIQTNILGKCKTVINKKSSSAPAVNDSNISINTSEIGSRDVSETDVNKCKQTVKKQKKSRNTYIVNGNDDNDTINSSKNAVNIVSTESEMNIICQMHISQKHTKNTDKRDLVDQHSLKTKEAKHSALFNTHNNLLSNQNKTQDSNNINTIQELKKIANENGGCNISDDDEIDNTCQTQATQIQTKIANKSRLKQDNQYLSKTRVLEKTLSDSPNLSEVNEEHEKLIHANIANKSKQNANKLSSSIVDGNDVGNISVNFSKNAFDDNFEKEENNTCETQTTQKQAKVVYKSKLEQDRNDDQYLPEARATEKSFSVTPEDHLSKKDKKQESNNTNTSLKSKRVASKRSNTVSNENHLNTSVNSSKDVFKVNSKTGNINQMQTTKRKVISNKNSIILDRSDLNASISSSKNAVDDCEKITSKRSKIVQNKNDHPHQHSSKRISKKSLTSSTLKDNLLSKKYRISKKSNHKEAPRRSTRQRSQPLAHWRNERLLYRFEDGEIKIIGIDSGTKQDDAFLQRIYKKQKKKEKFEKSKPKKAKLVDPIRNRKLYIELLKKFSLIPWNTPLNTPVNEKSDNIYLIKRMIETPENSFGYLQIPSGKEKPPQYMPEDDLHLTVIMGKLEIQVQKNVYILHTKDMFIIPRGSAYSIKNIGDQKALLTFAVGRFKYMESA